MSLVPNYHMYPASFIDSFQFSISKLHGNTTSFQLLFRHNFNSSSPFRKHYFFKPQKSICSKSMNKQYPQNSSRFLLKQKNDSRWGASGAIPIIQSNYRGDTPSSSWLEKWNEPKKQSCLKPSQATVNYRSRGGGGGGMLNLSNSGNGTDAGNSEGGGAVGSTMDRIIDKLKRFGYTDGEDKKESKKERTFEKGSVEDIFYVEEGKLPNSRGGFSEDAPLGMDKMLGSDVEVRFPWEKPSVKDEETEYSVKMGTKTSMAELTLPESEIRRLRQLTLKTKQKLKIGGSGVTQAVVEAILERWKASEIVRLKIEGAPALNMKRMHEILERKTGGLVIWRSGTSVSLYRGVSYEVPSVELKKRIFRRNESLRNEVSVATNESVKDSSDLSATNSRSVPHMLQQTIPEGEDSAIRTEVIYEDEMDRLLDDLGPRYTDCPGDGPLPVDADMLPSVVPGFQPPFRLLPYGVRPGLAQREATALRRLARTLPPHFALGRSRQLQGLAITMVKLWEKSSIAKVALKRGVQLTTSERMAEDLKKLTGGVLLSRNKDFLVFYRGKNFLSSDVTEALLERERLAMDLQDEEEQARLRAASTEVPTADSDGKIRAAGTLSESREADARWGKRLDDHDIKKILRDAELMRHASLVRKLEIKLSIAERKLLRAERALNKLEAFLSPSDRQPDPESITYEERFMFRKLGLRMKAFLLLGRRGVFDGTVENMHLHWKYRELVKIIVKAKNFEEVKRIALSLEAESGGILVSVDKISKGYAVIVFRGKDYLRPSSLRPKNLLTKRRALGRSIELQRREALLKHLSAVQKNIDRLRSEIAQMESARHRGDEELYSKLESAYPSGDEESDDEVDDTFLQSFGNERNEPDIDENSDSSQSSPVANHSAFDWKDQADEGKLEDEGVSFKDDEESDYEYDSTDKNEQCSSFQLQQYQQKRMVDKIKDPSPANADE